MLMSLSPMERHGFVVFALPLRLEKIDAFSTWAKIDDERPVVALSSAYQLGIAFGLAQSHELGHLVMHKGVHKHVQELERDANQFAAEFLLARASNEGGTLGVIESHGGSETQTEVARFHTNAGTSSERLRNYHTKTLPVFV